MEKEGTSFINTTAVVGSFIGEMSPSFGPRMLHRVMKQEAPLACDKEEWLLKYVLRDANLEYVEELDVKMTTKLVVLEEVGLCVVSVNFRDIADEEYSVPLFNATICVDGKWTQRMKMIFQPFQDRLTQLVRVAMHQLIEAEEELSSTTFAMLWSNDLCELCVDVDKWIASTIKRSFEPYKSSMLFDSSPFTIQAWVTASAAHHRCIIRGDDPEVVRKWIHTLTHFMLDDRLLFASDVCSTSVDGIVPDLHIQGTTAQITSELVDKLYLFQYPCCVVDVSRAPGDAAHVVPKTVYPAHDGIGSYQRYRSKWFEGGNSKSKKTVLAPFHKVSPLIAIACDKIDVMKRTSHAKDVVFGFLVVWRRKLRLESIAHCFFEKGLSSFFQHDAHAIDADIYCVVLEPAQLDAKRVAPKQQMYETRMDLF